MEKYYLFSAVKRCPPCRMLVQQLDKEIPNWKDLIVYIDADEMTTEQMELAVKLGVRSLPTFSDNDKILFTGFSIKIVKTIIELCQNT